MWCAIFKDQGHWLALLHWDCYFCIPLFWFTQWPKKTNGGNARCDLTQKTNGGNARCDLTQKTNGGNARCDLTPR